MKRKFTIRPAEWPSEDAEWELVFTKIFDDHNSTGNVERVSLIFLQNIYQCIGEFLNSSEAKTVPHREPKRLRNRQIV